MLGNFEKCVEILSELQKFIKIHETGRAEKPGETLTFVGKPLKMIEQGFTL